MSGSTSFRLSKETYELLAKNRDFYQSLFDFAKKDSPLLPKAKDAESHTESKVNDNGDVEVSLVLPVDDNADPSDGRLLVRDTFVFDPSERLLKSYRRSFETNGKGDDQKWKGWLGKYEALPDSSGRNALDPKVQSFAHRVAKTFGRPIVDESKNTLPDIKAAFGKEGRLLATTNQQVLDLRGDLKFLIRDKLNFYNLSWKDGKLEVTLQLSVDDDAEAGNGRIVVRDKFVLDAETKEFSGFSRSWELAPGAADDPRFQEALRKLQKQPNPSDEEASAFIKNLLPAILPKGEVDNGAVLSLLGSGATFPKGYASPLSKRGKSNPDQLKDAAKNSLEAMYVVSQEQLMKRSDESQGWAHFGGKVDEAKEKGVLESVFKKAKEASEKNPGVAPFEILQKLDLTEEEKSFSRRLLGDKLMGELDALAGESDPELRGRALGVLAQQRMLLDEGLGQSAVFLAKQLQGIPATKKTGDDILAVVEGKGNFGQKVGYVLPLFAKEVSKPSMLLGMAAAPFMGTAFELGGLKAAQWAFDAKKVSEIGGAAKFGAAVLGMTGEALGFTAIHRGFERLDHGSETAWKGMGGEIISSVMLFGGMRLTHGASGWATARMAEGRLGKFFGARVGEAEFAGALGRTPTGRILFDGFAASAGKGIPQLARGGKAATAVMNHLGGILTMQASGALSRQLGLAPQNDQSFGANFFDATVMYTQAMVGAHAANMASGGALQTTLGKFKMGVESLSKGSGIESKPAGVPDPAALTAKVEPAKADPVIPTGDPATPSPAPEAVSAGKPEAKVAEGPKKPSLFDRLFSGVGKGDIRGKLKAAREWLADLSPTKVKALEAQLAEARKLQAETETALQAKAKELAGSETQLAEVRAQHDSAKAEVEAKTQELAELQGELRDTTAEHETAKTDLQQKVEALARAEETLQQLEAQKADLEGKKSEAEKLLADRDELSELSELDLGAGSLENQINAARAELGKLRVEKRDAEIKAGAHENAANELRALLTEAETELARRKTVEQALKESEAHVEEIQAREQTLRDSLVKLRSEVDSLSIDKQGAERLTADQARKIAELEEIKARIEGELATKTGEIAGLRETLEARETEVKQLTEALGDAQSEHRSAEARAEIAGRTIVNLEKIRDALKREKTEVETALGASQGESAARQAKLEEIEGKLKEKERELGAARFELSNAESVKKTSQAESERLRGMLGEAKEARLKKETELNRRLQELQSNLGEKEKALEAAEKLKAELAESLGVQTKRAEGAEGREAEIAAERAAIQERLTKAETDLGRARKKLEHLTLDVANRDKEIARHKVRIEELQTRLGGLREKKTELEAGLSALRVEKARLEGDLTRAREELAAEKAKEPEIVNDLTREMELEERIAALETEKAERDRQFARLTADKVELDGKFSKLEGEKKEADKQLRSMSADLDIAQGAARGAREDLAKFQARANEEETRLKTTLDGWRGRAEKLEGEKAIAEERVSKLSGDLTQAESRIGELDRDLKQKIKELEAAQGANKVLGNDIEKLDAEIAELRASLKAQETAASSMKADLESRIVALEAEKTQQLTTIQEKAADQERLRGEIQTERGRLSEANRELRELKTSSASARAALEGEVRGLNAKIEAKTSELSRKDGELTVAKARVEELEADLGELRKTSEAEKSFFESQKRELEATIAARMEELGALKEDIAKVRGAEGRLAGELAQSRKDLAAEREALKKVNREFEEYKTRGEAEVRRLRDEAAELRTKESGASASASAKAQEVKTLEAGIADVRRLAEEHEAKLLGDIRVEQGKTERETGRAKEALRELEELRTKTSAEAESLRNEALESAAKAKLAAARAEELEASLAAERARIQALSGELAAARAEVDTLTAPASISTEAQRRAEVAGREVNRLRLALEESEKKHSAAAERVQAVEAELAALRSTSESEKEGLLSQVEEHRLKAEGAEERAKAAGLRITALEAEISQERAAAIALEAKGNAKEEAEALAGRLTQEIEGLNARILEAEQRAATAEQKASEEETARLGAEENARGWHQMAERLQGEKNAAEAKATDATKRLAELEPKLSDANRQRATASQELLGARARVTELEKQLVAKNSEIEGKDRELATAREEMGRVWGDSQRASQEAKDKISDMERELTDLRNLKEGFDEQLQIERKNYTDSQAALDALVAGETALRSEIDQLKIERNSAYKRARELGMELVQKEKRGALLDAAVENGQPGGYRSPHQLFGGADPRYVRVEALIQATALLGDAQGTVVGEAHLYAGGAEGSMRLKFADGSMASGRTSKGARRYQEDSIYMSRFVLPDGTEVKILAGSDGAGGEGAGELASSAFLQGVHANVVQAVQAGKVPQAGDLFGAGAEAVRFQRTTPDRPNAGTATGAGSVIVIVGNEAMIATAGDSSVYLARPGEEGSFEILGYSNVDVAPRPVEGGFAWNQITKGVHGEPRLYRVSDLKAGYRFFIASDGFHENVTGVEYKKHSSIDSRVILSQIFHQNVTPPTQAEYLTLRSVLKATAGKTDAADHLHDVALGNMHRPGQRVNLFGEEVQLPPHADKDNIFVINYEHGVASDRTSEVPMNYSLLEPVPTAEQIRAAQAAAEKSTVKGRKVAQTIAMDEPAAGDPYQPKISERRAADFFVKYVGDLSVLYGGEAEKASQQFLDLYTHAPELAEVFNPGLLARAEDKKQQDQLFDAALKRLEPLEAENKPAFNAAKAVLTSIKQIQRPFLTADAAEVSAFHERYQEVLGRIFGEDAKAASEIFATLFKNYPNLEATLNPTFMTGDIKSYMRQVALAFHPDRARFNEDDIGRRTFSLTPGLKSLYDGRPATIHRSLNGWDTSEALKTGRRSWVLDPKQQYLGGRNGDPLINIKMSHSTVSGKHFKLYVHAGHWVIESLKTTYGTIINGNPLEPFHNQALRNGDHIRLGVYDLKFQIDEQGRAVLGEPVEKSETPPVPTEAVLTRAEGTDAILVTIHQDFPVYLGRKHIADSLLSPHHVEFMHNRRTWMVRDVGSESGTQLNGRDIQSSVDPATHRRSPGSFKEIKQDDILTMGSLTFRFHENKDKTATLEQVAGQASPPSSQAPRPPAPPIGHLIVEEGKNYSFRNLSGEEVAEVFWDGYDNGRGEFALREITKHGEVWIQNGAAYEPLGDQTYALEEGAMFGLGSRPDQAQWYVFKSGSITAIQRTGGHRPRMPSSPGNLVSLNIPPTAQPLSLGRGDLGGNANISTRHLEFRTLPTGWEVRDAGSSNGTYLGQMFIAKGKGIAGGWHPIRGGEVLTVGGVFFQATINTEGKLQLNELPPQQAAASAEPIYPPASPVPFGTAKPYGPPAIEGNKVKMGWLRSMRLVESSKELGLQPDNPDSPENGQYTWVIRNPKGFLGMAKGVLGGDTELVRVEYLSEGRYKITNVSLKSPLVVSSNTGKHIQIGTTRTDFANIGDSLTFDGHTIVLHP